MPLTTVDGSLISGTITVTTSASSYANSAFNQANTANTNAATASQRAVTSGSYANSAYAQANTATTNAATADQRAVTSGVYANSAFATANTKFNSSGGTISGAVTISTGGLAVTGAITSTGDITAFFSDDRLKTKLGNIENALDKLMTLNGFYYEPNQTAVDLGYELKREIGVSAQEVQKVVPEIVVKAPISDEYLTVKYDKLIPLIIESIKELKSEIDSLKMPK
jgi:Chaperone of endosialidase